MRGYTGRSGDSRGGRTRGGRGCRSGCTGRIRDLIDRPQRGDRNSGVRDHPDGRRDRADPQRRIQSGHLTALRRKRLGNVSDRRLEGNLRGSWNRACGNHGRGLFCGTAGIRYRDDHGKKSGCHHQHPHRRDGYLGRIPEGRKGRGQAGIHGQCTGRHDGRRGLCKLRICR